MAHDNFQNNCSLTVAMPVNQHLRVYYLGIKFLMMTQKFFKQFCRPLLIKLILKC